MSLNDTTARAKASRRSYPARSAVGCALRLQLVITVAFEVIAPNAEADAVVMSAADALVGVGIRRDARFP